MHNAKLGSYALKYITYNKTVQSITIKSNWITCFFKKATIYSAQFSGSIMRRVKHSGCYVGSFLKKEKNSRSVNAKVSEFLSFIELFKERKNVGHRLRPVCKCDNMEILEALSN